MLFWGAWHDLIKSIIPHPGFNRYAVVLPLVMAFFIGVIGYFVKRPRLIPGLAKYVSLVVLIVCCLDIFNFVSKYRQYQIDHNMIYPTRPICNTYTSCRQPDSSKPDIYYIIFDEYTDNRSLAQLWHYNNSDITEWLIEKGFHIPDSSKVNYSFTPYSISSILNMNYPAIKRGSIDELPPQYLKAVRSMSDNETFCILQKEQYDFHFISPFNNTFNNLPIEREFDQYAQKKLFNHTFPGRLVQDFAGDFKPAPAILFKKKDRDNRLIINSIKSTARPSPNRPPQFVYGHLMITHTPHLYDSMGAIRAVADPRHPTPDFDTYVNQVKKANTIIQELVTHILTHNRPNTVIIIMGDHGFRQLPDNQSQYAFPNFCAFYFPDKKYGHALMNITAVNTFRIVFNQYFCQNLELLKDSSILVKY
jgi:hypothetical protein